MFYKAEEALERYLSCFYISKPEKIRKTKNGLDFETEHMSFHCTKFLNENVRGYKEHLIAVQEDLTWQKEWPQIRDNILAPMLMSPIDIQIFDGITPEEAEYRCAL